MSYKMSRTPVIRADEIKVRTANSAVTPSNWGPEGAANYLMQTYGTLNPDKTIRTRIEHPNYTPPKRKVKRA